MPGTHCGVVHWCIIIINVKLLCQTEEILCMKHCQLINVLSEQYSREEACMSIVSWLLEHYWNRPLEPSWFLSVTPFLQVLNIHSCSSISVGGGAEECELW